MKLKIFINENHEDNRSLINMDTLDLIITGDYDNDHIDDKIDGILFGFDYLGVDYEVDTVYIDEENSMFNLCRFY